MQHSHEQLNQQRIQNMEAHRCEVGEEDYDRIMPKIELLQRLAETERALFAVFDMNKGNYLLESSEQKRLLGSSNTDDEEKYIADSLYRNIHPEDLPFVLETDNRVYRFFAELPAAEKKDYKLIYDFRIKDIEGLYRRYMHQVLILELDKNGKSWLSLIISDLLPEKVADNRTLRQFINIKTGKLHLFNDDELSTERLLTKRETEILQFLARGYDSKSISDKLFISVNTVNNHRQNILRKTSTENTSQAILYCKRLGIL